MPLPATPKGPTVLRFLAVHAAIGAALGIVFAGLLLLTDAVGLGTLFAGANTPLAAWLLYFFSFALTFASLKMGTAVMLLPYGGEDR